MAASTSLRIFKRGVSSTTVEFGATLRVSQTLEPTRETTMSPKLVFLKRWLAGAANPQKADLAADNREDGSVGLSVLRAEQGLLQ